MSTNQTRSAASIQKVVYRYNGNPIQFIANGKLTVNATEMAKPFGKSKEPKHWLKNLQTKEFLTELSKVRILTLTDLVQVKAGGASPGTWFHEDVALEFARWLSPAFAIWCNDRIKELMHYQSGQPAQLNPSFAQQLKDKLNEFGRLAQKARSEYIKRFDAPELIMTDLIVYSWIDALTLEENLNNLLSFLQNNTVSGFYYQYRCLKAERDFLRLKQMVKVLENAALKEFNIRPSALQHAM